ncbi:MAG: hypothetical protein V3T05_00090 [Myxococcota bacterium]
MASTTIQNALNAVLKELRAERDRIAEAIADLEKTVRGFLKSGTMTIGRKKVTRKKTKKRKVSKKTRQKKTTKKKVRRKKVVWTDAMRRKARLRALEQHAAARKKSG